MWHEMKEYLRREVKQTTKQELLNGIEAFGEQLKSQSASDTFVIFVVSCHELLKWKGQPLVFDSVVSLSFTH